MSASTSTRRKLERLTRSDGKIVVIRKAIRVDVLWYPRTQWPSVLVRRTHDIEVARELAEVRWAELADGRPLTGGSRVGWWRTYAPIRSVPDDAAEDAQGRVVQWCRDTDHAAGPGVEFRP